MSKKEDWLWGVVSVVVLLACLLLVPLFAFYKNNP
jgi:bacteriorhodopsin